MTQYTFTFDPADERKFREVLSRLDEDEYTVIKEITSLKPDDRWSQKETVIEMEPDACLTFRLGMKQVKIRRERTEEELAAEKEIEDRNTIKVVVQVPPTQPTGNTTP